VEARAADLVALDEADIEARAGAVERGRVTTWPAPDDHYVVLGAQKPPRHRQLRRAPKVEPIFRSPKGYVVINT
jgi:hypothetical protein